MPMSYGLTVIPNGWNNIRLECSLPKNTFKTSSNYKRMETVKETGPPLIGTQISQTSTVSSKFQNDPGLCDKLVNSSVVGMCETLKGHGCQTLGFLE